MNWPRRAIWFLAGTATCLLTLLLFPFKFEWTFNVVEAAQLLITIVIAIAIQHYTVEKYGDFRAAKTILMQRAGTALDVLNGAHKLFFDFYLGGIPSNGGRAMIALKQNFSNAVYMLEQGMKKCNVESEELAKIVRLRGEYGDVLTGGRFPTGPYSQETSIRESRLYRALSDSLEMLVYDINNG